MGRIDVDKMLSEINWRHYKEWVAFSEIDPFGEWRGDLRNAQLIFHLVNMFGRRKGDPLIPIDQFILKFGKQVEPKPIERKSWQELKRKALWIARSFGWSEESKK